MLAIENPDTRRVIVSYRLARNSQGMGMSLPDLAQKISFPNYTASEIHTGLSQLGGKVYFSFTTSS